MDFRGGEGDVIDLVATALAWAYLDGNGNGVLDDDAFVASDAVDTRIDPGAATGAGAPDLNVITIGGVTGLTVSDFLLA